MFTEILLNPAYSLLNRAFVEYFESTLKDELLKCELNGYTQENYTVLLPSDELLAADGFSWQWLAGSNKYGFAHSQSGNSLGNVVRGIEAGASILVTDLSGHIIANKKSQSTSFTQSLPTGAYLVKVISEGEILRTKVIVK